MIVVHKNTDITEYVSSMSWGGSRTEVARKLELHIVNAPLDKNITPLTINLADPVYLFEDDGKTELFRGYVVEREASSTTGTVTYTCYDLLFYTIKSNATYNFSSKTAEAITQMVCDDMEIPVGSLAQTGLTQKLIVQNVSIYEIIMRAYTQAYQQNGVSYRVVAKKGYLNVEEMGKVVCSIEITEDSNITSSNYKESITNMVNKVRIYDGEGKPQGVVQNDADVKKYGIFQQTYTKEEGKDATTTAKSMFKTVEKTFTLECVNLNEAVTGAGAVVRDSSTGLSGVVWIDADTHTWQNGVATMSLTVTLEYASMNAQSVIGQGVSTFTDDGSTNMAVVTGATSGLGNGSGIDPNAGVDGKCSVSYRGEENLWGNIWTWLDAINIYNDKASGVYNAFVKPYGECKDDTTADGYKALDFNIATGEGYISGFGYDEDHPDLFLCAEHNGASNLPVGDYYWNSNDGFRVARLGGVWSNGAECGAWYLGLFDTSSFRYRDIGGRLLYVPQTKISA